MKRALDSWNEWWCKDRWLIGGSLIRIAFGFVVSMLYLLHIRDREFLFGPNGVIDWTTASHLAASQHQFGLFVLNPTDGYFNAVYFAGLAVSLLFMIGYKTRLVTPLFVMFTWSIYHRDPYIMDGGYRLMNILLLYLLVADLGRFFSIDAALLSKKPSQTVRFADIRAIFHNGAIVMCMAQICIVYIFSTFYKITGEDWQHGTALYYALSDVQFSTGAITEALRNSPVLITFGGYATLLYQSAFPWLIWHPQLKYVVIAGALFLHGSIAIIMGLVWFSIIMIACETIFIRDHEYIRIFEMCRKQTRSSALAMAS